MTFDNQRDNRGDALPDARGEPRAYGVTCGLPFDLACGLACVRPGTHPGARGDVRADTRVDQGHPLSGCFCEYGFSALQINVLALIYRAGARVTPYERISRQLMEEFGMSQSAESVRGVANRLAARGFIRRKQARDGTIRGVQFTIIEPLFCPHLLDTRPSVRGDIRVAARGGASCRPSILEEEIDRENLSISSEKDARNIVHMLEALTEDDLAYHWPKLAGAGFGTCQIRQIIERLAQVNIGAEKVMQGLVHAEWELENGAMRDKSGAPIAKPVDWVFISLSRTGYYRRPHGYVSPHEQAELDVAEEAERMKLAHEARKKSAFDVWLLELPPEERGAITAARGGKFPMPEDTALRLHFKEHVWPKMFADPEEKGNCDEKL